MQKSTITFSPIIDLNPNDESSIYSTLLFVIEQAKRVRVPVSCVTFDQPLWLKACGIIEEAGLDIVARLGDFHTLLSYLGAIGKVMKGSGIEELFNEVCAENTVQHIISGKTVSRTLWELLAESALISMLFEDPQAVNIAEVNEFVSVLEKKSLEEIETFCQTLEVREIRAALEKRMQELRETRNFKTLASVLVLSASIEEIHYCQKNIQLVTSPAVKNRYAESLCCI